MISTYVYQTFCLYPERYEKVKQGQSPNISHFQVIGEVRGRRSDVFLTARLCLPDIWQKMTEAIGKEEDDIVSPADLSLSSLKEVCNLHVLVLSYSSIIFSSNRFFA